MFQKGQKLYSITQFKCPKCHSGDLYPTKLLSFSKTFVMLERCPACRQQYVIEPGFYWGAMYIAYMLSSGIILGGFGLLFFVFGFSILQSFFTVLVILFLLYGLIFRMARSIWINLYVHYDPNRKLIENNDDGKG
jgi:uncharacterized protein (DUF983 family)